MLLRCGKLLTPKRRNTRLYPPCPQRNQQQPQHRTPRTWRIARRTRDGRACSDAIADAVDDGEVEDGAVLAHFAIGKHAAECAGGVRRHDERVVHDRGVVVCPAQEAHKVQHCVVG